jgi:hypothetical protein
MVAIIAENDSRSNSEVTRIEQLSMQAHRGWSEAQARSIRYETESGLADDDDDSPATRRSTASRDALPVELLDETRGGTTPGA